MLSQIDVAVDTSSTRVVGLNNAGAREIAAALGELAPEGVSVVPVDSSNAIALRGDGAAVAQLASIAADLDRRALSGSEIRVVFLEHAVAEQLLPVLQTLLGQTPTQSAPGAAARVAPRPGRRDAGRAGRRRGAGRFERRDPGARRQRAATARSARSAAATRSSPASRAPTRWSSPRRRTCSGCWAR